MVSEIVWSEDAIASYNQVITYLHEKWTEKEIHKFAIKVDRKLKLLQSQPRIGTLINKKHKFYRTLVQEKITLIYHYKPRKKVIELLLFRNNLQKQEQFKY